MESRRQEIDAFLKIVNGTVQEGTVQEVEDGAVEDVEDGAVEEVEDGAVEEVEDGTVEEAGDGTVEEVKDILRTNEETTEELATDDDAFDVVAIKKNRHIWRMNLVLQCHIGSAVTTVNPFLSDGNFQDLYFSEMLLASAPYRAGFKKVTKAYISLAKEMREIQHVDGTKPLLLMTASSIKNRLSGYQKLSEQWSDKTGAVFRNGKSPEEGIYDKGYENLTVKEKIFINVEGIIEDIASLKHVVTEKKYESEKVTARKEIGVASVIGSAVGNIVIENGKASEIAYTTGSVNVATGDITVTPNVAASVAKKMTGKSKSAYTSGSVNVGTGDITITPNVTASVAKKTTGKSKSVSMTPYDLAFNSLERATRNDALGAEERDKIIELREKRKHDEVMMRLDLDRERHEADVKRQNGMLQFQKEQAEKDDSFRREQLAMQLQQIESQKQQSMLMKFMMEKLCNEGKK